MSAWTPERLRLLADGLNARFPDSIDARDTAAALRDFARVVSVLDFGTYGFRAMPLADGRGIAEASADAHNWKRAVGATRIASILALADALERT